MLSSSVIFYKIASICLLILIGYFVKRMKLVPENSLNVISHYTISIATPCMVMAYMPRCIDPDTIEQYWPYPVLGAGLVAFSDIIGLFTARLFVPSNERATFRFLAAFPNWIFLGLAVCEPLFGEVGIRIVLLFNAGITVYLWSFGMTGFRPGIGLKAVKNLVLNNQIIATVVGLILAVTIPSLAGFHLMTATELAAQPFLAGTALSAWEAVVLLGATALPLSIFQIGLRLAGSEKGGSVEELTEKPNNRSLVLCSVIRLLFTPALTVLVVLIIIQLGFTMSHSEYLVVILICCMPTAATSLGVTDVYGGDSLLAARGVLWMTVASLATVPLVAWLANYAYLQWF